MKNNWSQKEISPFPKWNEYYSGESQKAWSFGLCLFVFFGLAFVGNTSYELLIAFFMLTFTGINIFINAAGKGKTIQACIVLSGYTASFLQVIYAKI